MLLVGDVQEVVSESCQWNLLGEAVLLHMCPMLCCKLHAALHLLVMHPPPRDGSAVGLSDR